MSLKELNPESRHRLLVSKSGSNNCQFQIQHIRQKALVALLRKSLQKEEDLLQGREDGKSHRDLEGISLVWGLRLHLAVQGPQQDVLFGPQNALGLQTL